jgi:dihydropyrimidinase
MPYAIGASDEQLLETFDVAAQNGAITLVHCESAAAIDYLSRVYAAKGELGIPSHYRCHSPGVEGEATARAAHLAALVDAPFYNVHMSSAESLEEIRRARAKEQPVYAETCPHFLTLTRELLDLPTTEAVKYVCTPALRERPHLDAMWGGIRSGDISVLASDYACWNLKDKRRGIDDFRTLVHGFGGIELMIPLIYSEGVAKQRISLSKFVAITSTNAAKIFGLYPRKGEIMPGADADVMIFDPEARTIIKCEDLHQGVDYNAWEGWEVRGWPTTVLSRGSVIVDNGELRASPGRGRFVRRDKFRRPDL